MHRKVLFPTFAQKKPVVAVICIYTTLSYSADSAVIAQCSTGFVSHFRKMILRNLVPYYSFIGEEQKDTYNCLNPSGAFTAWRLLEHRNA